MIISKHSWDDQLEGGLADKKTPADFDPHDLLEGATVELEHTDDLLKALEISQDHLTEDKNYYHKLKKMEQDATDQPIPMFGISDDVRAEVKKLPGLINRDALNAITASIPISLDPIVSVNWAFYNMSNQKRGTRNFCGDAHLNMIFTEGLNKGRSEQLFSFVDESPHKVIKELRNFLTQPNLFKDLVKNKVDVPNNVIPLKRSMLSVRDGNNDKKSINK